MSNVCDVDKIKTFASVSIAATLKAIFAGSIYIIYDTPMTKLECSLGYDNATTYKPNTPINNSPVDWKI
jgi:hypothetical protein